MIVKFQVTNFRSIRDTIEFTLEADAGQSKPENMFDLALAGGQTIRLLKSAVVYGPNASGKSNVIRAMYSLFEFIKRSTENRAEAGIGYYDPFLFDVRTEQAATQFYLEFLLPGEGAYIRYIYQLSIDRYEILSEKLDFYPKGQPSNLFTREILRDSASVLHRGCLGRTLGYKEYPLFKNQLFLSQFGGQIPQETLTGVYLYLSTVEVWNALNHTRIRSLKEEIAEELLLPENQHLFKRLNKLIRISDTRIDGISVEEMADRPKTQIERPLGDSGTLIRTRSVHQISAVHGYFHDNKKIGDRFLPLWEESAGTNVLFALGGVILKKLEKGGVLFFDELDNSLHPRLSKFLVRLFNNPVTNPRNAQIFFATHEVTLLDKDIFRKDQIWFCEKDEYGSSEVFSVKEFDGVRDNTPFDKWYMNGKFGGQPRIKELEFIFSND